MTERYSILRVYALVAVQIAVAVATAILVPLVFFQSDASAREFNIASQVMISILAALVVLLAPVSTLVGQILIEQRRVAARLAAQRKAAAESELVAADLLRIQVSLARVHGVDSGNLFFTLVSQDISDMADRVEGCARRRVLECQSSYRTTDPLLGGLSPEAKCRFFHYADNHHFMLAPGGHSLDFQDKLTHRLVAHKLGSVDRLVVVANGAEASGVLTWLLALFHRDIPGYQLRHVSRSTFDRKRGETGVRAQRVDVGIYGSNIVYVSEQTPATENELERMEPRGKFSTNPTDVTMYLRLFREAWDVATEAPQAPLDALAERLRIVTGGRAGRGRLIIANVQVLESVLQRPLPTMWDVVKDDDEARTQFEDFVQRFPGGSSAAA
jgi:hypothetical protein